MRKKFITLVALLITSSTASLSLFGQAGNVGIGTTSPTTKLDVNGGLTTREAAAAITVGAGPVTIANLDFSQFRLTGATAPFTINGPTTNGATALVAGARLVIVNASGQTGTLNGFAIPTGTAQEFAYSGGAWTATNSGGSAAKSDYDWLKAGYNFPTSLTDTGANIFHIGNVGIGTKTPTEKLHVETATDNEGIALSQTARTNTVMLNSNVGGGYLGFINNSASTDATLTGYIQQRESNATGGAANDLVYNAAGTGTHTFLQPVGIGTYNPTERLHVITPSIGEGIALSHTGTNHAIMLNSDGNGTYLGFVNNTANTDAATTAIIRQREPHFTDGSQNDLYYVVIGGQHIFNEAIGIHTNSPRTGAAFDANGPIYANAITSDAWIKSVSYADVGTSLAVGTHATVGGNISVNGAATVGNNLSVGDHATVGQNLVVNGYTVHGDLTGANLREIGVNANGRVVVFASDGTLKKNIASLTSSLSKVMKLNPVSFDWKDTVMYGKQREIGFVAQEVKEVVPEVSGTFKKDGKEYQTIAYNKLVPVLTKAIQEQQAIIEAQNKRIANTEARLKKLEALMNKKP